MNYYSTTFINGDVELVTTGRAHLSLRLNDFEMFFSYNEKTIREIYDHVEYKMVRKDILEDVKSLRLKEDEPFSQLSSGMQRMISEYYEESFSSYGLSFEYVEATCEDKRDYYCYQISCGGHSEEFRFYPDGSIEFIYLDWFEGIGFNVTNDGAARQLHDYFKECESIDFGNERDKYDYYDIISEIGGDNDDC